MVILLRSALCECVYCRRSMQCGRPGGFSDSEDSDDDFFFDSPRKRVNYFHPNNQTQRDSENDVQTAIAASDTDQLLHIITTSLHGDCNSRLNSGWSALHYAASLAKPHIVRHLISIGADVNLSADGSTALLCACGSEAGDEEVEETVRVLLNAGAGVNICERSGGTPLMRAAGSGRRGAVTQLLQQPDLNIEMRDLHGWTAVFWAARGGHAEVLAALLAAGARAHEQDRIGRSPHEVALASEHEEAAALLHAGDAPVREPPASRLAHWTDYYPIYKTPRWEREAAGVLAGAGCAGLLGDVSLRRLLERGPAEARAAGALPYQVRRLAAALRRLHLRPCSVRAVPGLLAHKDPHHSVLEIVRCVGSHLLQTRVLTCGLQRAPPPDPHPPLRRRLATLRAHLLSLRAQLSQISGANEPPVDLVSRRAAAPLPRPLAALVAAATTATCAWFLLSWHGVWLRAR